MVMPEISALYPAGSYGFTRKVSGYIVPPNSEHVYDDESLVVLWYWC